ncbi:ribonuclease HI [Halobellus clavatus]|jgi:ribonuclease HI|uniref:Ribonuclease HI n=1 Tax=Halobellus clavatus TaxID=660517 RepID=A0A1H3CI87_9EURY|nr:ribonuclease HI [Halobellus clavatus]SDX53730.1 ribonuclease HI [Halobellus clavatus]
MPSVELDPETARERLEAAGVAIEPGNTDHERWRAERGDANAVAYDETVVVQGSRPTDLLALLRGEQGGRAHVYFDGASRGNPGPAAIGWVIVTGDGIVAEGGQRIGETTNNRAEYEALERALEAARDHGFDEVDVRGDAQLIVRQVTGEYDTNNPELQKRRVRVRELLAEFDRWSIEHVPRAVNDRADSLANEALDDG